jgi:hypothetical protein
LEPKFELASLPYARYTRGMAQHLESGIDSPAQSFARLRPRRTITFIPKSLPGNPSRKQSMVACAYLLAYLGFYLVLGFAGIAGVSWLWMSMLR